MVASSRDILMRMIAKNLSSDSTPVEKVISIEFHTSTSFPPNWKTKIVIELKGARIFSFWVQTLGDDS